MLFSLPGVCSTIEMTKEILQEQVECIRRDQDSQEQAYEQKNNGQTWWEQNNTDNGQTSHTEREGKDKFR